jgi:hypothetical protein
MIKIVTTQANLETEIIQYQNREFCKNNNIEFSIIDEDSPEIEVDNFFDSLNKEERNLYLKWLYLSKGFFFIEDHVLLIGDFRLFLLKNRSIVHLYEKGIFCFGYFCEDSMTPHLIFSKIRELFSNKKLYHHWAFKEKLLELTCEIHSLLEKKEYLPINNFHGSGSPESEISYDFVEKFSNEVLRDEFFLYIPTWSTKSSGEKFLAINESIRKLKRKGVAVALISTKKEFDRGEVVAFFNRFISKNPTRAEKIDFFVFFDRKEEDYYKCLKEYEKLRCVNKINIITWNIPKEKNVYFRQDLNTKISKSDFEKRPQLGLSSGPNILFLNSVNFLFKQFYSHFLVLEADTSPLCEFWFDRISEYCRNKKFLVAGSLYRGDQWDDPSQKWNNCYSGHLNGVAIYRNEPGVSNFLFKRVEMYIKNFIGSGGAILNYDVALHLYSQSQEGTEALRDRSLPEYNLIDSPLFVNLSMKRDSQVSKDFILCKFKDAVILHQKINEEN